MRKLKNKIAITILFWALMARPGFTFAKSAPVQRERIEVKTTVDKNIVSIGDKIKYVINITKDKPIEIELPEFGQNLGNFAIKDFGSTKNGFWGKEKVSLWYVLDTYVTGKSSIPKAIIKYKGKKEKEWSQIETNELFIEVKSVLEQAGGKDKTGKIAQMKDIKGPLNLPSALILVLISAALIVLLGAGVFAGLLFRKKIEREKERARPADEIAYEQLEILKSRDYIAQGRIKEYYVEISDIIRHYMENRFKLKAPEMTTEEFLINVRDYSRLAVNHKVLLKEFLVCCDLVKFAKYAPPAEEMNSVFDSAKMFIDQTKEEKEETAKDKT